MNLFFVLLTSVLIDFLKFDRQTYFYVKIKRFSFKIRERVINLLQIVCDVQHIMILK